MPRLPVVVRRLSPRLGRTDGECWAQAARELRREHQRVTTAGASARCSARVGSALPFVAARRAQPPDHLVRVRGERQGVEVSVRVGCSSRARSGRLSASERSGDTWRLRRLAASATRRRAQRGHPRPRARSLTAALHSCPHWRQSHQTDWPEPAPRRLKVELAVQRRVELRDQIRALGRQRALWSDAAVGGVALQLRAAWAASAARALVRRSRPDVAARGAAPPQLLSRANPDPIGIEVTVQLGVKRAHQLGP